MTKQEIISTAYKVWGKEFYQKTSLSRLAQELGVSKSALYRHFKSKQTLLDAMYENYFDDYTNFIKPHYEKAVSAENRIEKVSIMIRAITEYYILRIEAFIFSLVKVYDSQYMEKSLKEFAIRGVNMRKFFREDLVYPTLSQLIIGNLFFVIGFFHKTSTETPTEKTVDRLVFFLEKNVSFGLGMSNEIIEKLDYKTLEAKIEKRNYTEVNNDHIFKAVALAIAEAGPADCSMDMVAKLSGLSKSSLYFYFKNKQDMLEQAFISELNRILDYTKEAISWSSVPEEQLYQAMFSIAHYLRARPEILRAADWMRIRRLELNVSIPPEFFKIFSGVNMNFSKRDNKFVYEQIERMILFLIVHTLLRRPEGMDFQDVPNESIRRLFCFIALGIHSSAFDYDYDLEQRI